MSDLEELLDEVRLLWHRLVALGEALHEKEPISLGMRAVLEFLLTQGPSTVPGIARSRGVTRQHVQALTNGLLAKGLVALAPNPLHKRSPLVALSPAGQKAIGRMKAREGARFGQIRLGAAPRTLREAATTLRKVREALVRPLGRKG